MLIAVTCDTCGSKELYKDKCYTLNVEYYGKSVTCDKCGHTKTDHHKYDYTFCSRKCLMEFLKKHEDEKYKHRYER